MAHERYWVETDRFGSSNPLSAEEVEELQCLADKIEKVLNDEQKG